MTTTSAGQERVLAAVGYFSHALHHLIAAAPWIALQTRLSLLSRIKQYKAHHEHEKAVAATTPPAQQPATPPLLALSALCSETRYTLRLFGMIPLWRWGEQTLRNPPKDPYIHAITVVQVLANTVYQVLENGGFLASKGVVSKRFVDRWGGIEKWYLWSVRAWFSHIVLQFGILWRQYVMRKNRAAAAAASGEKATDEDVEAQRLEVRAWRKSLMNCVFWAPLALHWSVEQGVGVPGNLTGIGGFMAGSWGFWDLWAATA